MSCKSYHKTLQDRIAEMRREARALVPWKIAHSEYLRNPRAFRRRYLLESLLEKTIENALPDTKREIKGIVDRLARRLGSRRVARDLILAAYESLS